MRQNSLLRNPDDNGVEASEEPAISVSSLLRHTDVVAEGRQCGGVDDIVVLPRHNDYAPVTGIVVSEGKERTFISADCIAAIRNGTVELKSAKSGVRPFSLEEGEISLKSDVLHQRVIDVGRSALVKVYDVRLARRGGGWVAVALDVHRRWLGFGGHASHPASDWRNFLPLGRNSKIAQSSPTWVGRLKPAQIADLIEAANAEEQDQLLAQVHTDPELEADVFEELDESSQAQVFKSLSDAEAAEVLSRMRADDVTDAVMELAQERRQRVIDLLPPPQRAKVLTLLGYHEATAGGLMGTEFLALPEDCTVREALQKVHQATTHQPEALITIHSLSADGQLSGTLGLVQAIQADPDKPLREVADTNIVAASPDDDILAVVNRMADFNLLSLPVINNEGRLLGVVTVDDALEAAIPRNWANR